MGKHVGEAWPCVDAICAAHCGIVKRRNDLEACGLGIGFDGGELAFVAILVGSCVVLSIDRNCSGDVGSLTS